MRRVINISLPDQLAVTVDKVVDDGKFASKSEFFRLLLRSWLEENEVAEELLQSRRELRAGQGRLLKSLKDLR